jgi:phosphosulfolactate phosphohydrolase-like enzyme
MFACSFPVAGATVQAVQRLNPDKVTFVITGDFDGEDMSCAEFLEARLTGHAPDPMPYLERVWNAIELRRMPVEQFPSLKSDLDYCTRVDSLQFAMPIARENGRLVIRPLRVNLET